MEENVLAREIAASLTESMEAGSKPPSVAAELLKRIEAVQQEVAELRSDVRSVRGPACDPAAQAALDSINKLRQIHTGPGRPLHQEAQIYFKGWDLA